MQRPKSTLLTYFDHQSKTYTPLDLASAKAFVLGKQPGTKIELASLAVEPLREASVVEFRKAAYYLASFEVDTVIFFLDNILWSGMFYEEAALRISRELKKIKPDIQIGFQSYKIRSERSVELLKRNSELDFILHDEPEIPLWKLLTVRDQTKVPDLDFRKGGGIITNPTTRPPTKLDTLPSPYLTGMLDNFLFQNVTGSPHQNSIFIQTARGCPFACHYCFRSVKFGQVRTFSDARVLAEIDYLMKKGVQNIFVLDDTFITSKERIVSLVKAWQKKFRDQQTPHLMIMTRPETLDEEIMELLAKIGIDRIQIGIQSINPITNELITRTPQFDYSIFTKISRWARKYKIKIWYDIIFGLPGDDLAHFRRTLDFAVSLRPWWLQVKQLYLNPDTLFDLERKRYKIAPNKTRLLNVPFVGRSENWRPSDIKKACNYTFGVKAKNPQIGFKIFSEYGYHLN